MIIGLRITHGTHFDTLATRYWTETNPGGSVGSPDVLWRCRAVGGDHRDGRW